MMRSKANVDREQPLPPGGTVTGIVASARVAGRFNVMVDDRPAHTLGVAALERLGLSVGKSTIGREEDIAREEATLRTYDRAVTMLAARGRAAKDLERQLIRKGEPADLARRAVERLMSEGFVDDESYARSYVRSKASGAGLARRRLQQELGRKGVERSVADEAIAEVFAEEDVDEVEAASTLATKRARSLSGVDTPTVRRRLYSFLARRGYSPSVISAAIAKASANSTNAITEFDEE